MPHLMAQVRLARTGGLAENVVVNTFHFESAVGDQQAEAAALTTALLAFYRVAPTGTLSPIQAYLPTALIPASGHEVRVYNMSDPEPRVPVRSTAFSFDATGGSQALPAEVAMCLSFRGSLGSGLNPARRRGRVYIGPLNVGAGTAVASGDVRPIQAFIDTLVEAGMDLVNAAGPIWSVYSPTSNSLVEVATVWADNAFDTQRRRGAPLTAKTFRPVP